MSIFNNNKELHLETLLDNLLMEQELSESVSVTFYLKTESRQFLNTNMTMTIIQNKGPTAKDFKIMMFNRAILQIYDKTEYILNALFPSIHSSVP